MRKISFLLFSLTVLSIVVSPFSAYAGGTGSGAQCSMGAACCSVSGPDWRMHNNSKAKMNFSAANKHTK